MVEGESAPGRAGFPGWPPVPDAGKLAGQGLSPARIGCAKQARGTRKFVLDKEDNYLYSWGMEFIWDPDKRLANLTKHGLDFADAWRVFGGFTLTLPDNRFTYGEMRFITIGLLGEKAVVIAHTETDEQVRVISMRKAQRHERELYFANL